MNSSISKFNSETQKQISLSASAISSNIESYYQIKSIKSPPLSANAEALYNIHGALVNVKISANAEVQLKLQKNKSS